jgi:amino-acid N-acetyltransferase
MDISIAHLSETDRPEVHRLLGSHNLPLAGFDDGHVEALVARDGEAIVGSAAIELYGRSGLLRSVAVAESYRGQRIGQALTQAAIDLAANHKLNALYLLTESAADFFPKFGFVPVSRADIPAAVRQSVEFTSACPASAKAFVLSFEEGASHER